MKNIIKQVNDAFFSFLKIFRVVLLIILGFLAAVTLAVNYIYFANRSNINLAVERPDLMEVVRKINEEEKKQIEQSKKDIKKNNIKRMLSPLVIEESEGVN